MTTANGKTERYEYGSPHSLRQQTAVIDRARRRAESRYAPGKQLEQFTAIDKSTAGFK